MKKITLSLLLVFGLMTFSTQAQIQKYTTLAGGALSGFYENDSKEKEREIRGTFNPYAAFFFSEYFALGAGLDYTYINEQSTKDTASLAKAPFHKESQFIVGPIIRGYMPNHVFAEVTAGVGVLTYLYRDKNATSSENAVDYKHNLYRATLGVGYAKFLNAKVAFEPLIRYTFTSEEQDQGSRSNRSGFQLLVGFQYYLFRDQMLLYK
jgi:hypothetical protein